MAINANNSNVKVVGGGLYTGIANLRVTMINPTSDEMKKVGMNPKNDPVYLSEDNNGIKKIRIDIFTIQESEKIFPKMAFFIEGKVRTNKDGNKIEWINKFGNSAWSTDITGQTPPQYDWFKLDGARPALVGEVQLTNFIKNWANVDLKSQAYLDDPMALTTGNLTELKALFAAIPNNEIQCLLGVKDNKYQDVYTGYFDRANRMALDQWKKHLEKDGNEYKANYQGSLKFQPYQGGAEIAQDSPSNLDGPGVNIPPTTNTSSGKPAYSF